MSDRASTPVPAPRSFAALRHRGYRAFLAGNVLAMMADNIEHVISYWVMFQKFQSPALGGFAVISHWLPFLLFSVPVGALADRVDPRRLIQCGMALFIIASLGWGWFFATDTLQMWHAMVLLVVHGCAGVLWQTASQVLIHDIVPRDELPSAVRLNATGRYLGVLVGPAVGGALLLGLGPADGMWVNTLFYLPLVLWLWRAPYGRAAQGSSAAPPRPVRGVADIVQTARDIGGHPVLVPMILLAGAASFFVGNSYQAQMPAFAHDLGHGRADASYSALLAADAAGALLAGFLLESAGWLRPRARTALLLAMLWCAALGSFALVTSYAAALALLFVAGFFELAFGSMAQTLVQLEAPKPILGRVLGLFNMAALGMRAFSGVMVGLSGSVLGVQAALAAAASAMLLFAALLLWRASAGRREAPVASDRG